MNPPILAAGPRGAKRGAPIRRGIALGEPAPFRRQLARLVPVSAAALEHAGLAFNQFWFSPNSRVNNARLKCDSAA